MAPPKRKTTGRVTPKGTRPGQPLVAKQAAHAAGSVEASSRYTPPVPREFEQSGRWVPILMTAFLVIAFVLIILRYVVWDNTNLPVVIGLGFLLAGLYTATKWK